MEFNFELFLFKAGAQTALARKTLAEVEARHREIQKVTRDIELINEMFTDLAMFVESQVKPRDQTIDSNGWFNDFCSKK